jgi:hypothetical protein
MSENPHDRMRARIKSRAGDDLTKQTARAASLQPIGNSEMTKEPLRNAYSVGMHVILGLDTRLRGAFANGVNERCTDDDQE